MAATAAHPGAVHPSASAKGVPGVLHRARTEPAYGAFLVLWIGFIALPLLMGLDKYVNLMTDWEGYLAPWIVHLLPFSAHTAMVIVGSIEVVAAILMFLRPRYASYVVALWLVGIIINLLTYSGYYDVALRDFGLLIAAVALTRLASVYDHGPRPQDKA